MDAESNNSIKLPNKLSLGTTSVRKQNKLLRRSLVHFSLGNGSMASESWDMVMQAEMSYSKDSDEVDDQGALIHDHRLYASCQIGWQLDQDSGAHGRAGRTPPRTRRSRGPSRHSSSCPRARNLKIFVSCSLAAQNPKSGAEDLGINSEACPMWSGQSPSPLRGPGVLVRKALHL